jgi:hypothetical protein
MSDPATGIVEAIIARRRYGKTTCVIKPCDASLETPAQVIDTFVSQFGFRGLGTSWIAISIRDAQEIATAILHKDLAYNAEIMNTDEASAFAAGFLAHFGSAARSFTNGNLIIPNADPANV